jgi:hypothetical protein
MRPRSTWPKVLAAIVGTTADPHPHDVHRRAEIDDRETGALPYDRVPPVGADDQAGVTIERALRRSRANARHYAVFQDEPRHLGFHEEAETRIALRVLFDEVEKIPLRHERQKLAVRRHMPEVSDGDDVRPHLAGQFEKFLVGTREEFVKQPKLVHDLERRGMNRVAAKITQEISVLFEDDDIHAHARQQQSQHHPGRTAAGNAAARLDPLIHLSSLWPRDAAGALRLILHIELATTI